MAHSAGYWQNGPFVKVQTVEKGERAIIRLLIPSGIGKEWIAMDESNLIENGGFMDRGDAEVLCSRVWDGDGTHKKSFSHALVLGKREDGALFVRDARTVRENRSRSIPLRSSLTFQTRTMAWSPSSPNT